MDDMSILSDSLESLSAVPAVGEKVKALRQDYANRAAKIAQLESAMGIPHTPPIWNRARSNARLAELEKLMAAKNPAPVAAAAAAAPAPAARPFESSGDSTIDRAMRSSGTHNLRAFKAKALCDQLEVDAAKYPAESLSRKAVESNLSKARAAFNACN